MTTYRHPVKNQTAQLEDFDFKSHGGINSYYVVRDANKEILSICMFPEYLLALGFEEVKEVENDEDWISKAFEEFIGTKTSEQSTEFAKDEMGFVKKYYREVIEKHLPKIKRKLVLDFSLKQSKCCVNEICDFLREHGNLEE